MGHDPFNAVNKLEDTAEAVTLKRIVFRSYFPLSASIFCGERPHKRISAPIGAKSKGNSGALSSNILHRVFIVSGPHPTF